MKTKYHIEKTLLFRQSPFELHIMKGNENLDILRRIGQARTLAFQQYLPTETTEDLDKFDNYYHHLYLLDTQKNKIAGAYRLGVGDTLFAMGNIKAFYTHTLFKFNENFHPILKQSLELGRSFVLPEYQKEFLPLLLLWKGVYQYFDANKQLNYMMGAVSIPGTYSSNVNSKIIDFLYYHYRFDDKLLSGMNSVDTVDVKSKWYHTTLHDLEKDIQEEKAYIPVLLKRYLQHSAKILGFNIDPCFGNSIDTLILIDKKEFPNKMKKYLMRNQNHYKI